MEEKVTFGKYILQKRKQNNLSQKQLAGRLYVTESAVSKWERGVSYPDISLVAPLCEVLNISEHELITATDDFAQRELERQAKSFRTVVKAYSWVFYAAYAISLLACFISNLATAHRLSWFFIVLAAELVTFSLVNLPVLVRKHKGLVTTGSFFLSLNLLLFVCCVYTGGDWFYIAFTAILFAFAVLFLPCCLHVIHLPKPWGRHKALLTLAVDTILLFVLVAVSCVYAGNKAEITRVAFSTTAFCVILPWLFLVIIRYVNCNPLFKTALCLFVSGIYEFFTNPALKVFIDHESFQMPSFNLTAWTEPHMNGNITLIAALTLIFLAVCFVIGGIAWSVKQQGRQS